MQTGLGHRRRCGRLRDRRDDGARQGPGRLAGSSRRRWQDALGGRGRQRRVTPDGLEGARVGWIARGPDEALRANGASPLGRPGFVAFQMVPRKWNHHSRLGNGFAWPKRPEDTLVLRDRSSRVRPPGHRIVRARAGMVASPRSIPDDEEDTMSRSLHGPFAAMLREAHAASTESAATGDPDRRGLGDARRARLGHPAATADRRLSRRSLLKAGTVVGVGARPPAWPRPPSQPRPSPDRDRRRRRRRPALRPPSLDEVAEAVDGLRVGHAGRGPRRHAARLLRQRPDRRAAR